MRTLTPAQRHRARVLAEQAHTATPYGRTIVTDAMQLMQVKLATDARALKLIESKQLKGLKKAALLPEYLDYVAGALAGGGGTQDTVLSTLMVWAIDAGAYSLALTIAAYVLQHGIDMPDKYERKPASVIVDEFADAYLRGQWAAITYEKAGADYVKHEHGAAGAAELLARALEVTAAHDLPDQARAKLRKAVGYALLGKVQTAEQPELEKMPRELLEQVQELLAGALTLDSLCGVKKDLERIERKLAADATGKAKLPTAAADADSQAGASATAETAAAATATAAPNTATTARKRSAPAKKAAAAKRAR